MSQSIQFHHPILSNPVRFLTDSSRVALQQSIRSRSHARHGGGILSAHLLALLADACNVRPADGVPVRDVLLHACREAALLLGRERVAGCRDAALEAVFVEFLWKIKSENIQLFFGRKLKVDAYADEGTGIGHGSLSLELLHDCGLHFFGGAGCSRSAAAAKERWHGGGCEEGYMWQLKRRYESNR